MERSDGGAGVIETTETLTCVICNDRVVEHVHFSFVEACGACCRKYPASLLKACFDTFDYAMGLRDRRIIRFENAKIHGEWVTLTVIGHSYVDPRDERYYNFERGLDVRIADIVWCADAPFGS